MALCLSLAMAVGSMTGLSASVKTADAVTNSVVSGGAMGGAASGGAVDETPVASGGAVDTQMPPKPAEAPQSLTARGGSKRVRLTWSKVSLADGYYIYARPSTEPAFTKVATVQDGTKLTYVKKSLLQNTKYYFYVSAYRKINGVEYPGELSAVVSAKTASVAATSKAAKKYSTKSAFKKSPAYKKYTKMKSKMNYTKSFAIPGLKNTNVAGFACTTMVPQAVCYAGNYLLVSAYDSKGVDYSVIYVVSKAAKSYITTIVLPSKAQVGGMAFDGTNIWISKGSSVACFPYSFITQAVNSGSAYKSLSAYTKVCKVKTSASYLGYYEGTLWVGPNTAGKTTMYGYTIQDKATTPSLTQRYSMAMLSRTQGITFQSDGTMLLTRSYRNKTTQSGYVSQIRSYRPSFNSASATGKIKKNAVVAKNTMPPKAEGITIYGTYTYVAFSSGAYSSCKYPVDRVIALKTNKLL